MRLVAMVSLISALFLMPPGFSAADSHPLVPRLCSVVQVFECAPGGECFPISAEAANIPMFLNIDFDAGKITATEESGREEETAIENIKQINGKIILQGAENGRGWTIVISDQSGKMTASVADDQVAFVVFGASTKR
jgi:hypothetical protein